MHLPCRSGQQGRGGNSRSGAQENLFDANSDAAPQKESDHCGKKEIADAHAVADSVGRGFAEEEKDVSRGGGNAIAYSFAKKEETFANARGVAISVAKSEKEKGFTNSKCNAKRLAASKEEGLADATAV